MLEYIIIAFSFALSSLWFIHKRGLAMHGVIKYSIIYDIMYIIMAFTIFPVIFIAWLFNSEKYVKDYGLSLSEVIKLNNI